MASRHDEYVNAVEVLAGRAREVRALYSGYERRVIGREWTTAEVMSGFVVDVGDLTRLVMAATGARRVANLDEQLAHELADCLWSLLVLADRLQVDLGESFGRTMEQLEQQLSATQ
jgi:NTP pyrophosphatase (non-canonical NTP hydrolase)